MHVAIGQTPEPKISHGAQRPIFRQPLALLLALLLTSATFADHRIPLTIGTAEDLALENEPGGEAIQAKASALREQAVAAGKLPDPTLRIGLANFPIEDGGFSTEGMTQAQLGIRQVIPRGKARELRSERLLYLADNADAGSEARSRAVLEAARSEWLEYYYWQHAIDVLNESRPLFEDLVTITRSMYSVGRKSQFDVLQAELELQRLDDRMISASRAKTVAQASLSEWLGDDAFRPVSKVLPVWTELPSMDVLSMALLKHPLLQAADARVSAEDTAVDLADENNKPDWALDVGYGYREGFLPSGEPRSDFISVAITVDLPFFSGERRNRELAAALAERSAAKASRRSLLSRLNSELVAEHAAWTDLSRRLALYESQILKVSAASAEAALHAYRSDAGDFADVLRSAVTDLNARLEHMRLEVERAKSYSVLANLGGINR